MDGRIDFARLQNLPLEAQAMDVLEQVADQWDTPHAAAAIKTARAEGYTVDAMRREIGVPAAEVERLLAE